ncbi:MAG: cadmium-translocating P-type ATPase [Clostridiales bacterium]|nr:cadmium-translocating P-type ATPase [Clostridiales bacterium]
MGECGCSNCRDCGHEDREGGAAAVIRLTAFISGIAAYAAAVAFSVIPAPEWGGTAAFWLYLAAYALIGGEIVIEAIRGMLTGNLFDENFLMSVASAGALIIGEYPEAVAVMLFYRVGEYFQERATNRSRGSIRALLAIRPETAHVVRDGAEVTVDPESVAPGEIIAVKPGERIPLDGVITEGATEIDTSPMTGESAPVAAGEGEAVMSGGVNLTGYVRVRVTAAYADSTVARVLDTAENAAERKTKIEKFITRFSRVYTPAVIIAAAAIALFPPILWGGGYAEYVHRALVFLVVSCPCALVISVPLTFFAGIGRASRSGILARGGDSLQALAKVNVAVFDKTGTLTTGKLTVRAASPAPGFSETELLSLADSLERHSNHPAARGISAEVKRRGLTAAAARDVREVPGAGLTGLTADGEAVLVGNARHMGENGISYIPAADGATTVYAAKGGRFAGSITLADTAREGARTAVSELAALGAKSVMLTGDGASAARETAEAVGITDARHSLLPDGKVAELEAIYKANPRAVIMFAGDGVNDAPVLARADVGAAMGGAGSAAAIESADIVIMNDDPRKLPLAVRIARKTMRVAKTNIAIALSVKAAVLLLGAVGFASMWLAVFADVGVAIIVILYSMAAASGGEM